MPTPTVVRIGANDTAQHAAFLRYTRRLFPGLDFGPWYDRGGWVPEYEANAIEEAGEIVANASVMRMQLVIDGAPVRGVQLGAVGSMPERRGAGLVRRLLEDTLERLADESELVFLFANPVVDFYPRFGFRRVVESRFELDLAFAPGHPAPRVDLDPATEREAWLAALTRAPSPTARFGARGYGSVALWHVSNFYPTAVRRLAPDAYAVAVQEGDRLELLDLAAPEGFDLAGALPRLAEAPVARVGFGFAPERFFPEAAARLDPDSMLFVRGKAGQLGASPFRFPALAQT
ncbi:MAG: GNAT family N-acetyltransferase [Myxococcales bacterium]|jgi:ribosomal protein S18 acetylase RimI-like enzyme